MTTETTTGPVVPVAPASGRRHGTFHPLRVSHVERLTDDAVAITFEVPDKGPIALVFRPDPDGKRLTYTSPRTRNNAVMEKTQTKCD